MKISYFSRRILFSSGGGEQCDYYLKELFENQNNYEIKIISEKKDKFIKQSNKRNLINKISEECEELIFYFKNIKFIFNCDYLIITGRSLSASIISLLRPSKIIHNIHGETNKLALIIFKLSNPILFFWGNSYVMSKEPNIKRSLKLLIPSSYTIRKLIKKSRKSFENKNNLTQNSLNILWVGRLEPIKDPQLFLDLLYDLNVFKGHWEASMIGNGSLRNDIKNQINKLPSLIKSRIDFYGQIDNSKIEIFYKKADILVITSLTESFSLVILEAIINNTKIVSVPIKELQNSFLSEYINFSSSREPKDISKRIIDVYQNKSLSKDYSKILVDVIKLYENQTKAILKWLK